ncbi:MAG: class I SAM-dependent methyltransferase [Ilumatobacter sp.]|nr:class I SAM-dependent methyltransferase [Ilumatobacter sp.]
MSGPVRQCRSCGHDRLEPVLDLGSTPVANALVDPGDPGPDPVHPLGLVFCERCALVQLSYALPADVIFDADYPYYSSFSDALLAHAAEHVRQLVSSRRLDRSSFVVEVASNDGYLLRHFEPVGVRVLGIDPSPGPAAAAEHVGVPTVVGFFGRDMAARIRSEHGPADVIVANNVMAHVPDLNDFVGGLATLVADGGLITIENPYVRDLVEHVEFDTIYHEHYCYFSCSAVDALVSRHGLHLVDVEYFPALHGGTLRWHVGTRDERTPRCAEYLDREAATGLTEVGHFRRFADRVADCQRALTAFLDDRASEGRTVAAYGAAAKGATLLNSTGIGTDRIAYVVDRNVHKQGRLMPGCRLPIRPVEVLVDERPDDLLLLAWNFASEIVAQQADYARLGGRFHVPVPQVRELTLER